MDNSVDIVVDWDPLEVVHTAIAAGQLAKNGNGCDVKYAIVLLNQKIANEDFFISLWNEASLRMLVDGGANHWRQLSRKFPDLIQLPHILCGNFDSIKKDAMDLLKRHEDEVEIIHFNPSDDKIDPMISPRRSSKPEIERKLTPPSRSNCPSSDFGLALRILKEKLEAGTTNSNFGKIQTVIAYCETTGHFDEIMMNIQTLFRLRQKDEEKSLNSTIQIYLISSSSVCFLLPKGTHRIKCGKKEQSRSLVCVRNCAFLPIGSPCIVTTKGLTHDLDDEILAFGMKVVTKEQVQGEEDGKFCVTVTNSSPILCDLEIKDEQLENNLVGMNW